MPQVNIEVVGEPPSPVQRASVSAKITELMVDILGRTRKLVLVSVSSSAASNWTVGGEVPRETGRLGLQAIIRIPAGTATDEQKAQMIAATTTVLRSELGEPIFPLYVTFDEVAPTAFGYNGRTIAEIAAAKTTG